MHSYSQQPEMSVQEAVKQYSYIRFPHVTPSQSRQGKPVLEVAVPGFSFQDSVGNGITQVRELAMTGQWMRAIGIRHHLSPDMFHLVARENLLFVFSARYIISPDFYKSGHCDQVLRCTHQIVNVGRTSFEHLVHIYSSVDGSLLGLNLCRMVCVDRKTRRPIALPSAIKALDSSPSTHREGASIESNNDDSEKVYHVANAKVARLQPPASTLRTTYRATWSDTDIYRHVNQGAYLQVAYNAVGELCAKGQLSGLLTNIGRYQLQDASVLHLGEVNPGNQLSIHVWENDDSPLVIHVEIQYQQKPVYQATLCFCQVPIPSRL